MPHSIARYGEKEIAVNTLPYVDATVHRDFANFLVSTLSDANPFVRVTYVFDARTITMADVINITEASVGLASELCNVEEVRYERVAVSDKIRVTAQLSRISTLEPFLLENHAWDVARLIGF